MKTGASVSYKRELALSEKPQIDLEERAIQITNADLNSKKKQTFTGETSTKKLGGKFADRVSGWTLVWLAYQSTGVIYGDIGTSPLYVYSSTFTSQPSYEDLVGGEYRLSEALEPR